MLRDDDKVQLVIKDLHEGDAGEITCELVNKKGREAATCKLGVQGEGLIEGSIGFIVIIGKEGIVGEGRIESIVVGF